MKISKGILFIIYATLAFAVMNTLAKELSAFHPMQVVFFRAFGTFVFMFPYMLSKGISIRGKNKKQLVARGILGVISLALFFFAVQRIQLGSAISIRYLGPIFGSALAMIYLNEKVNRFQWLSFAIAFSGVIVLKGFDIRIDLLSLIMLILSAFTVGGVFVLIKYLSSREHHLTIINYFMMISLGFSLLFTPYWRMPMGIEWFFAAGIGFVGLIGQVFMTMAFQTEDTSILAPFKYLELVFGLILGYYLFDENYEILPLFGIILIIIGMLANVLASRVNHTKHN